MRPRALRRLPHGLRGETGQRGHLRAERGILHDHQQVTSLVQLRRRRTPQEARDPKAVQVSGYHRLPGDAPEQSHQLLQNDVLQECQLGAEVPRSAGIQALRLPGPEIQQAHEDHRADGGSRGRWGEAG